MTLCSTQPRQLFQEAVLREVPMAYFLKGVTFSGLDFRHDDWRGAQIRPIIFSPICGMMMLDAASGFQAAVAVSAHAPTQKSVLGKRVCRLCGCAILCVLVGFISFHRTDRAPAREAALLFVLQVRACGEGVWVGGVGHGASGCYRQPCCTASAVNAVVVVRTPYFGALPGSHAPRCDVAACAGWPMPLAGVDRPSVFFSHAAPLRYSCRRDCVNTPGAIIQSATSAP